MVDGLGLHYVPAVGVLHDFGDGACRSGIAFHLFADVGGIEDGGAALYSDSFFHFLHPYVVAVAVIAQVGIGVFSGDVAHRQVHASHELVHVVEAQRTPCVALAGLYDGIGTGQGGFERILAEGFPVLFASVISSHIVQVGAGYLFFIFPPVSGFYHSLDAGAVSAVYASEYTVCRHFAGIFRCKPFLYQGTFGFNDSCCYLVFVHIVFGCRSHFYGTVNQEEAGCR